MARDITSNHNFTGGAKVTGLPAPSSSGDAASKDYVDTKFPSIVTESTTSRTLALTDAGKYIRTTNGSAVSITVPPNSSVNWAGLASPPEIYITQAAAGQVTIVQGSGVTVNTELTRKSRAQGAGLVLKWVASDVWDLLGAIAAT